MLFDSAKDDVWHSIEFTKNNGPFVGKRQLDEFAAIHVARLEETVLIFVFSLGGKLSDRLHVNYVKKEGALRMESQLSFCLAPSAFGDIAQPSAMKGGLLGLTPADAKRKGEKESQEAGFHPAGRPRFRP